jgi:vacuolar-type H+-ATPase subunit F/Vma7
VILPLFIGDEITATGYRQAGVRTHPACADELGAERLRTLQRRARPLLVIVPDAAGQSALPDIDAAVDRVLGIES